MLGLEEPAKNILMGLNKQCLSSFIQPTCKDLDKKEKVEEGIRHIISNIFGKNSSILEEIRNL